MGHSLHTPCPGSSWYAPEWHSFRTFSPLHANPTGQSVQLVWGPSWLTYLPSVHSSQFTCGSLSTGVYQCRLISQGLHRDAPVLGWWYPPWHGVLTPLLQLYPGSHSSHPMRMPYGMSTCDPSGQVLHRMKPLS